MIIDSHCHVFETLRGYTGRGYVTPVGYGQVRFDNGETIRMLPPLNEETRFTAEMLLAYMDWVGVDKALIMSHNFHGYLNDYVAACVRKWPDRFFGACSVDPFADQRDAVLKRLADDMGFRNFKLELSVDAGLLGFHPGLRLNAPRMMELWRQLNERKMTLMLDLGFLGEPANQKDEILQIVQTFPDLTIVVMHLCYPPVDSPAGDPKWVAWDSMLEMASHPRIYVDISAAGLLSDDEEYPFVLRQECLKTAVDRLGAHKFIWGTDVTGFLAKATYHQGLDWVRQHCAFLTATQKAMILGETARKVYHVEE